MIQYKQGDLLKENAEAIVNTVNCVGIMGRGVALQFKAMYPENFKAYEAACKADAVQPGRMFVVETQRALNPRYIINFPTKRHWKGKSRIEDIETGLKDLVEVITKHQIRSIALPPLGCGLGGLDWNQVRPRIEAALSNIPDLQVIVFAPRDPLAAAITPSSNVPNMTAGRAALVALMDRYLKGLLDPFITLLEVHKLMYFLQVAGQPLRLQYVKAPYGPYAENLRHVLKAVEGHLVQGYADGGDAPDKQLSLVPGALEDATRFLESDRETQERMEKVQSLVDGFESSFGLELLATVHWIIAHENPTSLDDVVRLMHQWNERKKQFSPYQIQVAVNTLLRHGWIQGFAA